MPSEVFEVQLVSPEQVLYTGDAKMVVVRTLGGGDIAFEENHAPFLGALAAPAGGPRRTARRFRGWR